MSNESTWQTIQPYVDQEDFAASQLDFNIVGNFTYNETPDLHLEYLLNDQYPQIPISSTNGSTYMISLLDNQYPQIPISSTYMANLPSEPSEWPAQETEQRYPA